jgi:hypothetical protein
LELYVKCNLNNLNYPLERLLANGTLTAALSALFKKALILLGV